MRKLALIAAVVAAAAQAQSAQFTAQLSDGSGTFQLILSPDGTRLEYRANCARAERIFNVHVHLGGDESAPVVAVLHGPFLPASATGQPGSIGDADLIGPLAGQGVAALVSQLRAGAVSVHVVNTQAGGTAPLAGGDAVDVFGRFAAQ